MVFFVLLEFGLHFLFTVLKKLRYLTVDLKFGKKKKFTISRLIPLKKYKFSKIDVIKNQIIKKNEIKILKKKKKEHLIIDARPKDRFLGKTPEPRPEVKSGNIPKSINIPFNKITDKEGRLLNFVFLKKFFHSQIKKKTSQIICSCGSGVTACNIFFILEILGIKSKKLYDGSWAEWGKK